MYHLTMFCFQACQKDVADIEQEWETVWEVFSELSKKLGDPAVIPYLTTPPPTLTSPLPLITVFPLLLAPPPSTVIPTL